MKLYIYILVILFAIGVYYTEISRMFIVETGVEYSIVYPFIILLSNLAGILCLHSKLTPNIKKLVVLTVFTYCISLLHSVNLAFSAKFYYISLILPATTALFIYKILQNGFSKKHLLYIIGITFILVCFFFFRNYQSNILLETQNQNNAAYTILYFLPLILFFENKYVRYTALLITAIALLFSLKRGGTLAFVIALGAYLYVEFFVLSTKRTKTSYFFMLLVGVAGVYEIYSNFFVEQTTTIMYRFTVDDGGSGRDEIYEVAFNLIGESNLFGYIFGHGYDGVSLNSPLQRSAHNDWLEYLYDYGFLGLLFLASFMYGAIRYTIQLIKKKSQYASAAVFAIFLILVNSVVAHIFYYEWYLLLFSIFFGMLFSLTEIEANDVKSVSL